MSPLIGFCADLDKHPVLREGFVYAWLEGMREAALAYVRDIPDWDDPDRWPAGRIFGQKGEYHWRSETDGSLHAVLILEEGPLPHPFHGDEIQIEPDGRDSDLMLLGDWVDGKKDPAGNPNNGSRFYARDLPKIQDYPIPPDQAKEEEKTPHLIIRRYRHETKGEFIRCVGLSMKADEQEETVWP